MTIAADPAATDEPAAPDPENLTKRFRGWLIWSVFGAALLYVGYSYWVGIDAVQEALQRHLEALAEQARRDPANQGFDPERNKLDAQDMKRLAEQMRDAAQQDKMDDARDKLAELERMLDDMKNARQERGKPTERQKARADKRQRGERQMSAVQDMVKREGTLLDNAQSRAGQKHEEHQGAVFK